ncbi:MAG: CRISPR-associated helicase Cas3' [Campylobacteraceae bacterium]|jgi:CRISPR-associated endonuclease/helicase Cas3|nr:CRISPR-associated helicase Cas3' [Campylobacteraceae bacterium]
MNTTARITPLSDFEIDEKYLAHTPNETLIDHANLTLEYFYKIINAKNMKILIDILIKKISDQNFELIKEMFVNAVYLHDTGKKNPYFQANKMKNKNEYFKECFNSTNSTAHSAYSSDLYIGYYSKNHIDKITDIGEKTKMLFILYSFSYQIAKHHGKLNEFAKYKDSEKIPQKYWSHLNKYKIPHFEFYILNKLLFSLLISSDYYSTTAYKSGTAFDDFGLLDEKIKTALRKRFDTYKNGIKSASGINEIRDAIYNEAQNNLIKNISKHIFYLEAPTGSGKTITSINLALRILENKTEINKVFYIFPFNTLVEQTKSVFDNIFGGSLDAEVINSVTPFSEIDENTQENEETKYNKTYINRLFFHKPFIITTHVNFFNILFGVSKEDNFPLWQLANSVIILDEIQSYDNNLWMYMADFFDKYAELLNIKIIIMSATLPKLDYFLEKTTNFTDLICDHKKENFFQNSYFKDRVKMEYFKLLDEITIDELFEKFLEEYPKYQKILFEFIKKQTARDFFNLLAKNGFENIYELSGDDNKAYRHFVIEKSKENKPIIIVATQVIEAGIDIDMDMGFKNISTLDGEEQFMGRINRSCLKNHLYPKVCFFNLDNANKIYKNDNRLEYNLKHDEFKKMLENKDFQSYYKAVLEKIKKTQDSFKNGLNTLYDSFEKNIKHLDYKAMKRCMTLIDAQTFTLYFPFKIDISKYKNVKEFQNIDMEFMTNGLLDGEKVWNKFLALNAIESFVKKEVEKSKINSLMQFFTFNIFKYGSERPFLGENINGIFYVKQYEDFITKDGKFDRAKFNQAKECEFL